MDTKFKVGQTVDISKGGYEWLQPIGVIAQVVKFANGNVGYEVACKWLDGSQAGEPFFLPQHELKLVKAAA